MSEAKMRARVPLCPSMEPTLPGSMAFGVVGGTANAPMMTPLAKPQPVDDKLLALTVPVTPTEVFRFAAPCQGDECAHFRNAKCTLIERITRILKPVTAQLPACGIRQQCRWWEQEREAACMRCPQVVTDNYNPSVELFEAVSGISDPVATHSQKEKETVVSR